MSSGRPAATSPTPSCRSRQDSDRRLGPRQRSRRGSRRGYSLSPRQRRCPGPPQLAPPIPVPVLGHSRQKARCGVPFELELSWRQPTSRYDKRKKNDPPHSDLLVRPPKMILRRPLSTASRRTASPWLVRFRTAPVAGPRCRFRPSAGRSGCRSGRDGRASLPTGVQEMGLGISIGVRRARPHVAGVGSRT